MSTITLRAALPDWGYDVASRAVRDPQPTPPCETFRLETWLACPGWVRWELRGAIDSAFAVIWVAQQPRLRAEEDLGTEVSIAGSTVETTGHAHDVRVELVGHRRIDVYLDEVLSASGVAAGVTSWQSQPWFVLGEGNSGVEFYLDGQVDGASGLYAQTGHLVRYFGAHLSVEAGGVSQPLLPEDANKSHAMGPWGTSGVAPSMGKRQPALVGDFGVGHGDHARLGDLEMVVQPRLAVTLGDPLVGSGGGAWPVEGWLAGLDGDGVYGFANGRHALASPLGMVGGGPRSAHPAGVCAARMGRDDLWRVCRAEPGEWHSVLLTSEADAVMLGGAVVRSADVGLTWYANLSLPSGRSLAPLAWTPPGGYLSDADWGCEDFPLAVGCQPAGDRTLIVAQGYHGAVTVADLSAQELGPWRPWPWTRQLPDGSRQIDLLAGGRYWRWQAPPNGAAWTLLASGEVGPQGGAMAVAAATGLDGSCLATGYEPEQGAVVVWWQAGSDGAWAGPHLVDTTGTPVAPYAAHLPDGGWEVGWLVEEAWVLVRADGPAGPWRRA